MTLFFCGFMWAWSTLDIIFQVFSYVDISDLARCAQVCRSWKVITQSSLLWNKVLLSLLIWFARLWDQNRNLRSYWRWKIFPKHVHEDDMMYKHDINILNKDATSQFLYNNQTRLTQSDLFGITCKILIYKTINYHLTTLKPGHMPKGEANKWQPEVCPLSCKLK